MYLSNSRGPLGATLWRFEDCHGAMSPGRALECVVNASRCVRVGLRTTSVLLSARSEGLILACDGTGEPIARGDVWSAAFPPVGARSWWRPGCDGPPVTDAATDAPLGFHLSVAAALIVRLRMS